MSDLALGELLGLLLREVEASAAPQSSPAHGVAMTVTGVDVELPAHLRVEAPAPAAGGAEETRPRMLVTLPSLRENPPAGRMGRLKVTVAPVAQDANGSLPEAA